jgi:hypothetical protein
MMLGWMVLERLAGLHGEHIDQHATYSNFVAVPAIAIYVLALRDKRQRYYQGHMTYGQGVKTGLFLTLFITALSPLLQWFTFTFVTTQYFSNAIRHAVQTQQMPGAEAAEYFTLKNYLLQGTMGTFVMGMFTTLVVAFFTKSSRKTQPAVG